MEDLKKLLVEFDLLKQRYERKGYSLSGQIDEVKDVLNQKYSVSLKNTDSKAENTLEHTKYSEAEIVSKIEDIAADLAEVFSDDYLSPEIKESNAFSKFKADLIELFKTYNKSLLAEENIQMIKYSDRGETESKIAFKTV